MCYSLPPEMQDFPGPGQKDSDKQWLDLVEGEKNVDIIKKISDEPDPEMKAKILEDAVARLNEEEAYVHRWLSSGGVPEDMKPDAPSAEAMEEMAELSTWEGVDTVEKRQARDEDQVEYMERQEQKLKEYANSAKERMGYTFTYKRKLLGDTHPLTMQAGMLFSRVLMQQRDYEEAERMLKGFCMRTVSQLLAEKEAIEQEQRKQRQEPLDFAAAIGGFCPLQYRALATHFLGELLLKTDRVNAAHTLLQNAAKGMAEEFKTAPSMSHVLLLRGMANCHVAKEEFEMAEGVLVVSMKLYDDIRKREGGAKISKESAESGQSPRVEKANCIMELAKLKMMRAQPGEARTLFGEAAAIFQEETGRMSPFALAARAEGVIATVYTEPYETVKAELRQLVDDAEAAEAMHRIQRVEADQEEEETVRKDTGMYLQFLQKAVQLSSAFEDGDATVAYLDRTLKEQERALETAAPNSDLCMTYLTLAKAHMSRGSLDDAIELMENAEALIIRSFGNPSGVLAESFGIKGDAHLRHLPFYQGPYATTAANVPEDRSSITEEQKEHLRAALKAFRQSADIYTRFNNNQPDGLTATATMQQALAHMCLHENVDCLIKAEEALWIYCPSISRRTPCEEDILFGDKMFAEMGAEERVDFGRAAAWHAENLAHLRNMDDAALWLRFAREALAVPVDMSAADEAHDEEGESGQQKESQLPHGLQSPQMMQLKLHLLQVDCARLMWLANVSESIGDYFSGVGEEAKAEQMNRHATRAAQECKEAQQRIEALQRASND